MIIGSNGLLWLRACINRRRNNERLLAPLALGGTPNGRLVDAETGRAIGTLRLRLHVKDSATAKSSASEHRFERDHSGRPTTRVPLGRNGKLGELSRELVVLDRTLLTELPELFVR